MAMLEIVLVLLNVGVVHVDGDAAFERLFSRIPKIRRIQIGIEQIEQRSTNPAPQIPAIAIVGGKHLDDFRQDAVFFRTYVHLPASLTPE
jgi:hypothetical protein